MPKDRYLIRIEASIRIDIDLYRAGNASSPRLDNVRDRDIVKFKDSESGLTKVRGMSVEFPHLQIQSRKRIGGVLRQVRQFLPSL